MTNDMKKFKQAILTLEGNIDVHQPAHHAADFERINAWMVKAERSKTRAILIAASVATGMILAALITIDPIAIFAEHMGAMK